MVAVGFDIDFAAVVDGTVEISVTIHASDGAFDARCNMENTEVQTYGAANIGLIYRATKHAFPVLAFVSRRFCAVFQRCESLSAMFVVI